MLVFKKHDAGFGNLLILLSDSWNTCKSIHKDVYDRYELGNCVSLNGYTVVDNDIGEHPPAQIAINAFTVQNIHPRIREFVRPTDHMNILIGQHIHLLEGVSAAVHIRRGSYSGDSTQFKNATDRSFFHCSDEGIVKFEHIIEQTQGNVYVASDSNEIKNRMKQKYGTKVRALDTEYAITAQQDDSTTQTIKNLQDVYLEWFLMSMCPIVYITGGDNDLVGFSTYSYTAAIYGKKPFNLVFNN